MQFKAKKLISMLLIVAMVLGLSPSFTLPVFAAGNTIYIVDAGDERITTDPTHYFTWTQLTTAVAALTDGDTLDVSEATPDAANRTLALGSKSVTIKGHASKEYPINITTSANLILDNYKSRAVAGTGSSSNSISFNTTGTEATLTIYGICSIVNDASDANGYAISISKNLNITGNGTLNTRGYAGIQMAANTTINIDTDIDVVADGYRTLGVPAGIYCMGDATITGNGSLISRGATGTNAHGVYVISTNGSTRTVEFSGLRNLTIIGAGNGYGIGMPDTTPGIPMYIFDLPNDSFISGGEGNSCGIYLRGIANNPGTINNLGTGALTFVGGEGSSTLGGIYSTGIGYLVLAGNTINAIGGGKSCGIFSASATRLDLTGMTADVTAIGGDTGPTSDAERPTFSSGVRLNNGYTIDLGGYDLIAKGGANGGAGLTGAGGVLTISTLGGEIIAIGGNGTAGYGTTHIRSIIGSGSQTVNFTAQGSNGFEGIRYDTISTNMTVSGNINLSAIGGTDAQGLYLLDTNSNKNRVVIEDEDASLIVQNNSVSDELLLLRQNGTISWKITGNSYISVGNGAAADVTCTIPAYAGTATSTTIKLDSLVPAISAPNSGALANGSFGTAYNAQITANNSPSTWQIHSGELPAGLSLGNDGVISGTPTAGGFFNFSVTATNASGTSAPVGYRISVSVTPAQTVSADKDWLTFDVIKDTNTAENNITANLTLPIIGNFGSTISWESSDTAVITNSGAVTRSETKAVTLTASITSGDVTDTKAFVLTVISSDSVNLSGVYLNNNTQPNVPYIDIDDTIAIIAYGQPGATVTAVATYDDVNASSTGNESSVITLVEEAGTGIYRGTLLITDGMVITGIKATMTLVGKNPSNFNVPNEKIPETRGSLRINVTNGASTVGLLSAYSKSLSAGSSININGNNTVTISGLKAANDYQLSMIAPDGYDMGTISNVQVVAGRVTNINFTAELPTMLNAHLSDKSSGLPMINEFVTVRDANGKVIAYKMTDADGNLPALNLTALNIESGQDIELIYSANAKTYNIGGTPAQREYPTQTTIIHSLISGANNVTLNVSEINRSATITVSVRNQNLDPVENATISIKQIINSKPFFWTIVTDASGQFNINVVPGVVANLQFVGVPTYMNAVSTIKNVTVVNAGGTESVTMDVVYLGDATVTLDLFTQKAGESSWTKETISSEYEVGGRSFTVTATNESSQYPIKSVVASNMDRISIPAVVGDIIKLSFDGVGMNFGKAEATCRIDANMKATAEMRIQQPGAVINFRLIDSSGRNLSSVLSTQYYNDSFFAHSYVAGSIPKGFSISVTNAVTNSPVTFDFLSLSSDSLQIWVPEPGTYNVSFSTVSKILVGYREVFSHSYKYWCSEHNKYETKYIYDTVPIYDLTGFLDNKAVRNFTVGDSELLSYGDINMSVMADSLGITGQFTAAQSVTTPGGSTTLNMRYFREDNQYNLGSFMLQVPPGTSYIPGSLVMNNVKLNDPAINNGQFAVSLTGADPLDGYIAYQVEIDRNINVNRLFAEALYMPVSGSSFYVDTVEMKIQVLSLDTPEYTARRDMTIRGKAPAGSEVTVYDRGLPIGSTMASSSGTWYMNVLLPGEDGIRYLHELIAEAVYNNEKNVTDVKSMWYEPLYPQLSTVTISSFGGYSKTLDVSGSGWVSFPIVGELLCFPLNAHACFTDNNAVSNVMFCVSSGDGVMRVPGVFNAQRDRYEALLTDIINLSRDATEGFIWVEYEASVDYLLDYSETPLTEAQYRATLSTEYSYFNVKSIGVVQQYTPEELGMPARIISGALTGRTYEIENYPYGKTMKQIKLSADMSGWSDAGKTPTINNSRYAVYEEYRDERVENGEIIVTSFVVIVDKTGGANPITGIGYVSYKDYEEEPYFEPFAASFSAAANSMVTPMSATSTPQRRKAEKNDNAADTFLIRAQSALASADSRIAASCADDDQKSAWTNQMTAAWNTFVFDWNIYAAQWEAIGYDDSASSMLSGMAWIRLQNVTKKFEETSKQMIKTVDDYDKLNCKEECPPGYTKKAVIAYDAFGVPYETYTCVKDPEPPNPPTPPGPNPKYIIDPSGIVYEVTMDEPIEGVTATLLFEVGSEDDFIGTGEWIVFDMAWYEQINPQITEADGWYAWDVPKGNWKVMYEKEGYRTEYSEEMEVPPIRLDVHQTLESLSPAIPQGAYWSISPESIDIVFDRYVKVSDINASNVSVYTPLLVEGNPIGGNEFLQGTFEPVDPVEYKGDLVAKTFTFTLYAGAFTQGTTYNVSFMPVISSYAGVPLGFDISGSNYVLTVTTAPPVPVKGIQMNVIRHFLEIGDTVTADPTVYPENAASKTVTWKTSNASVATVDDYGEITAKGLGTCFVTATTSDGNFEAYANVYVSSPEVPVGAVPVTGVTLNKSTLNLKEGDSEKLIATVLPADATNKGVVWSVCDTNVITVDQQGNVTAVGVGQCKVTVTTYENGFSASCDVTVTKKTSGGDPGDNPGGNTGTPGGTVENKTISVNGLNINVTVSSDGIVTVKPTEAQFKQIIDKLLNGDILFCTQNLTGVTDPSGIILEINPAWLINAKVKTLTLGLYGSGGVRINAGMLTKLAKLNKVVQLKLTKGSLVFDILADGKSIGWYDYENPILVILPVTDKNVVMKNTPRSWVKDWTLYGLTYSTGRYEAVKAEPINFTDTAGKWMNPAAQYMSARGIISGIGNNLFAPERNVTRGEFVTMLMRALNIEPQGDWRTATQQFSDVPEGAFYYDTLLKAKALGIVNGVGDNKFNPTATITRQDMFTMLYNAMMKCGLIAPVTDAEEPKWFKDYTDTESIAGYARKAMATFIMEGIVSGKGNGILDPKGTATRGEAAQIIYNMLLRDAKDR